MQWNKKTIENSILAFVEENGYLPHPSDFATNDSLPSRKTFSRNMDMNPVEYYLEKYPELCSKGYTDRLPKSYVEERERILKQLDDFVEKNHRIPKKDELTGKGGLPTNWQVRKYCGNITSLALKRYPEYCNRKYNDYWLHKADSDKEHIIDQVKIFVEKNDRMPTKEDLHRENDMPTYHQVRSHFASLKGMIEEIYPNEMEHGEVMMLSM